MKFNHLFWLWTGVILSILLSGYAVYRSIPLGFGIDYFGILFSSMSILVTVLIGTQIVQYIQIEDKLKKIASIEVNEVVNSLINGFGPLHTASGFLFIARRYVEMQEPPKAYHNYFEALREYLKISNSQLSLVFIRSLLKEVKNSIEADGKNFIIYEARKASYLSLLKHFEGDIADEVTTYIQNAQTCELEESNVISELNISKS